MTATTVHMGVYDTLSDWEVGYATAHINSGAWQRDPGRYRVVTVGDGPEPVTTMGGVRITPDVVLEELRPDDSAMLILPGADTWLTGGLAAEGLLDDRPHTSNAAEFLEATGYGGRDHYREEPAVTDGKLVTASATAPVEFAREVLALLDVYEPPVLAAWYKLYGLHDPAGYYELMAATS